MASPDSNGVLAAPVAARVGATPRAFASSTTSTVGNRHGKPAPKKFDGLEVCRFVCALAVLIFHYQHFTMRGVYDHSETLTSLAGLPLSWLLWPVYKKGYLAVQVFWCISGYIFFWKYASGIRRRTIRLADFAVFRFSRLYPLHFVTLLYVALVQWTYVNSQGHAFIYGDNTATNFVAQLGMASNWLKSQPFTFNGPIWSVSAEVVAYLLFFAAAFAMDLTIARCAGLIATCFLLLQVLPKQPVLYCTCFFLAGGFVYLIGQVRQTKLFVFALVILIAAQAAALGTEGNTRELAYHLALAGVTVAVFAQLEHVARIDLARFGWVGNLTYASYLVHFPLQLTLVLVVDSLGWGRTIFSSTSMFCFYLVATLTLSAATYMVFEVPAQRLIRTRWSRHRRRDPLKIEKVPGVPVAARVSD